MCVWRGSSSLLLPPPPPPPVHPLLHLLHSPHAPLPTYHCRHTEHRVVQSGGQGERHTSIHTKVSSSSMAASSFLVRSCRRCCSSRIQQPPFLSLSTASKDKKKAKGKGGSGEDGGGDASKNSWYIKMLDEPPGPQYVSTHPPTHPPTHSPSHTPTHQNKQSQGPPGRRAGQVPGHWQEVQHRIQPQSR